MPNNLSFTGNRRPFPWYCPKCRKKEVYAAVIEHTTPAKHDGKVYEVHVSDLHAAQCRSCGELVFDDLVGEQIAAALRAKVGLLTPQQIHCAIEALGITQKELAARLGIAEATLSRWCTGALIQSHSMDNYLRVFFEFPELREVLVGSGQNPDLGAILKSTDIPREPVGDCGNLAPSQPCSSRGSSHRRHRNPDYERVQRIIQKERTTWGSTRVPA